MKEADKEKEAGRKRGQDMRMYFRYMKLAFRGQLQYRASFLMTLAAQMLVPFTIFAGMLLLFDRFHRLGEWSVDEVMLCFACTHIAFALSECFARGFDLFSGLVSQGEFDRVLVRPRNTVLQVLGARFEFSRIGKVALFSVVLGIALTRLSLDWNPLRVLALVLMIVCGSLVFTAIFMMAATACFWTIQGIEIPARHLCKGIHTFFHLHHSVRSGQLSSIALGAWTAGCATLAGVSAFGGPIVPRAGGDAVAAWRAPVPVGRKLRVQVAEIMRAYES